MGEINNSTQGSSYIFSRNEIAKVINDCISDFVADRDLSISEDNLIRQLRAELMRKI